MTEVTTPSAGGNPSAGSNPSSAGETPQSDYIYVSQSLIDRLSQTVTYRQYVHVNSTDAIFTSSQLPESQKGVLPINAVTDVKYAPLSKGEGSSWDGQIPQNLFALDAQLQSLPSETASASASQNSPTSFSYEKLGTLNKAFSVTLPKGDYLFEVTTKIGDIDWACTYGAYNQASLSANGNVTADVVTSEVSDTQALPFPPNPADQQKIRRPPN